MLWCNFLFFTSYRLIVWVQPSVSKQVVPTVCINILRSREESSRHALKPDKLPDSIEILDDKYCRRKKNSYCYLATDISWLIRYLKFEVFCKLASVFIN